MIAAPYHEDDGGDDEDDDDGHTLTKNECLDAFGCAACALFVRLRSSQRAIVFILDFLVWDMHFSLSLLPPSLSISLLQIMILDCIIVVGVARNLGDTISHSLPCLFA